MLKRNLWEGYQEDLRKARDEVRLESARRVQQALLRQMEHRFGSVPQRMRRRVKAISSLEDLALLLERVMVVGSLEEMVLR